MACLKIIDSAVFMDCTWIYKLKLYIHLMEAVGYLFIYFCLHWLEGNLTSLSFPVFLIWLQPFLYLIDNLWKQQHYLVPTKFLGAPIIGLSFSLWILFLCIRTLNLFEPVSSSNRITGSIEYEWTNWSICLALGTRCKERYKALFRVKSKYYT